MLAFSNEFNVLLFIYLFFKTMFIQGNPSEGTICYYRGPVFKKVKGCRMGRSDKVSLWYVALLINTIRFLYFRISNC